MEIRPCSSVCVVCGAGQVLEDEMDLLGVMICRSKVWRSLRLRRLVDDLSNFLSSSEFYLVCVVNLPCDFQC